MNKGIDIGTILNKFDDMVDESGKVKTYGIRFLERRNGNKVIGEMLNARKGVKNPHAENSGKKSPKGKYRFNLKAKGSILLYDEKEDRHRSPKVACIFAFRDHGSTKWVDRV